MPHVLIIRTLVISIENDYFNPERLRKGKDTIQKKEEKKSLIKSNYEPGASGSLL
jgi:hypothetical protein